MTKPTHIPLDINAIKGSARWRNMSDSQRGWYISLLIEAADSDKPGWLVNDMSVLWAKAGAKTMAYFQREGQSVLACFNVRTEDGRWISNRKLLKSLANHADIRKHRSLIKRGNGFVVPSLEEVKTYLEERKSPVDAETFWNFYESKGWKVGNQPMKQWRSAVVTWERKQGNGSGELCGDPSHMGRNNRGDCFECGRRKA